MLSVEIEIRPKVMFERGLGNFQNAYEQANTPETTKKKSHSHCSSELIGIRRRYGDHKKFVNTSKDELSSALT